MVIQIISLKSYTFKQFVTSTVKKQLNGYLKRVV